MNAETGSGGASAHGPLGGTGIDAECFVTPQGYSVPD
jgi:hypothetical protein